MASDKLVHELVGGGVTADRIATAVQLLDDLTGQAIEQKQHAYGSGADVDLYRVKSEAVSWVARLQEKAKRLAPRSTSHCNNV